MSHVSTTAHYNLPIYGGTDIINPLTDVNGTNEALDTTIYEIAQELASGVTDIADVKSKVGDASLDTVSQNISGAVNELKGTSDAQASDITTIEASVGTLQTQMTTATGNITTLTNNVTDLQNNKANVSDVATNTEDIADLKGGRDLIIISASYGITPSASDNCVTYLKQMVTDKYANIYDISEGGAGFVNGRYLAMLQSLAIEKPNYVKDILVIGFGNDIGSTSDNVLQAMRTFSLYCREHFVNANIMLAPVSTQGTPTGIRQLLILYRAIAKGQNVHLMGVMTDLFHILAYDYSAYLSSDNVHPTSAGAKFIAKAIYNVLSTGSFNVSHNVDRTTSDLTDINPSFNIAYFEEHNTIEKMAKIFYRVSLTVTNNVTLSHDYVNPTPLFPSTSMKGSDDYLGNKNIDGLIYDISDGSVKPITVITKYDSNFGGYYVSIATATGASDNLTLVSGHTYRITASGILDFSMI